MKSKLSITTRLENRLKKYEKNSDNGYVILARTAFYAIKELIKGCISLFSLKKASRYPGKLSFAIKLDGGMGDNLILTLWVKEFTKHLDENCIVDLFPHDNQQICDCVAKKHTFVNEVFNSRSFDKEKERYDVVISFRRLPYFEKFSLGKIRIGKQTEEFLIRMHEIYTAFFNKYSKFYVFGASFDTVLGAYTICRNENRIQQPDLDNFLGLTKDPSSYLSLEDSDFKVFYQEKLNEVKYITVTRSVDQHYDLKNNVRCWPLEYYEDLIKLIKNAFPEIKIVQLGPISSIPIKGIDINLLGKTSLAEVKGVLKKSLLHIDNECGFVHLKHFLNGTSAVIFGPTPLEFYSYSNNINLKSSSCSSWCEWISDNWQNHCIRGFSEPPCQLGLRPDYVFNRIEPFIRAHLNEDKEIIEKVMPIREVENDISSFKGSVVIYGKNLNNLLKCFPCHDLVLYDEHFDYSDNDLLVNKSCEFGSLNNLPLQDNVVDFFITSRNLSEFAKEEIRRVIKNRGQLICVV